MKRSTDIGLDPDFYFTVLMSHNKNPTTPEGHHLYPSPSPRSLTDHSNPETMLSEPN